MYNIDPSTGTFGAENESGRLQLAVRRGRDPRGGLR
jgi:hypothetical protein